MYKSILDLKFQLIKPAKIDFKCQIFFQWSNQIRINTLNVTTQIYGQKPIFSVFPHIVAMATILF